MTIDNINFTLRPMSRALNLSRPVTMQLDEFVLTPLMKANVETTSKITAAYKITSVKLKAGIVLVQVYNLCCGKFKLIICISIITSQKTAIVYSKITVDNHRLAKLTRQSSDLREARGRIAEFKAANVRVNTLWQKCAKHNASTR
jgi:hypothetical protein